MQRRTLLLATSCMLLAATGATAAEKLKALIIEGQNNHRNWPQTSQMMKSYLEGSGLFDVDITRTAARGTDPDFTPEVEVAWRTTVEQGVEYMISKYWRAAGRADRG